jgi:hypothetical protein
MTESKKKTSLANVARASEHCVDRFVEALRLVWASPPATDASEVFRSIEGDVAALPEAVTVERALAAVGFESRGTRDDRNLREHVGRRDKQRLTCACFDVLERIPTRSRRVVVEWKSGERPPISSAAFDWFGRSWPLFFDDATLYAASRSLLIVEGRIPQAGFGDCVRAYREWASSHGLSPHVDEEPDLRGDLQVADAAFVVTIQDRDPFVTISVQPKEGDG